MLGQVYYDLLAERAKPAATGGQVAIVCVEQLAPMPGREIAEVMAAYPGAELV